MPLQKQEDTSLLTRPGSPESCNYRAHCSCPKEIVASLEGWVPSGYTSPYHQKPWNEQPWRSLHPSLGDAQYFFLWCSSISLGSTNHLPHRNTTPHTKKDAIAISRESVPLLTTWGKGTSTRAVFWRRRSSVDGAYVCKQVQSACISPSGITEPPQHVINMVWQTGKAPGPSSSSIWERQPGGLSARYSLYMASAGWYGCALYSHGLYTYMKLNGIKLGEFLSWSKHPTHLK